MTKNIFLGPILVHLPQIRPPKLFFKNLASSFTRYYGQPLSCTISENTNDPILRKLSDGRTGRQTRLISYDAVRLTSSVQ